MKQIGEVIDEWNNKKPDKASSVPKEANPQIEGALGQLKIIGVKINEVKARLK
jgi:hypothetical protein